MQHPWTADRVGTMCRLYMAGHKFADIGQQLGCTKNAAVGKFNRLLNDGHALAHQAARERATTRMSEVSEWMARYGGSIATCARSLGVSYESAKAAWDRVRAHMGPQAV